MKRLARCAAVCLLMWLSGAVGALLWLGFFESQLGSLSAQQAILPLIYLPLLNSGGLLLTWDVFSRIELWIVGVGIALTLAGCVAALRKAGTLAISLLFVGSAAWSIKACAVFYGLMSI